jgi:tetratricopeptide (TPR) repeat protein
MAPPEPTFVFNNPFYRQSATMFNYSQPLPARAWDDAPSIHGPDTAIDIFDQARDAFQRNELKEALALVDKAIQELPTDATLHEFRALCLFALQEYKVAAATLYAVLAAGPGWDWETMRSLYGDVAPYTDHLRLLESYLKANPKSAAARFVLAYHYLVLGHQYAAIQELENVVKLLPDSQLSAEMLAALKFELASDLPLPK